MKLKYMVLLIGSRWDSGKLICWEKVAVLWSGSVKMKGQNKE
jgi:hypothetical protein